uniref:Forkhead box protein Q1-like n=1 Tax=Petromyzon marinus TaxID=7757 RepID=A0AAJ7X7X3_PETMA|nr:forkhead box protein Q1-like [Petromyzon marinus]
MCADQLAAPEASSPGCAHPTAAAVAVIAGKGKSGGYTRINKPAASYTALIATAIQDSPQKKLTLLEIIGRLQQQYECFNGAYKGWKNSVRHTLSVNKCFVKATRRRQAEGAADESGSPDSAKSASSPRHPDGREASGSRDSPPPPPPPASGSPGQSSTKFSGPFSIESLLLPSKGESQAAVARARRAFAFAGAEARWDVAAFGLLAHERARLALADTLALLPLQQQQQQQQRGACGCPWPAASELICGCQVTYPGTRAEGAAYGFASAAAYIGMPLAFGSSSSSGNFSQPVC